MTPHFNLGTSDGKIHIGDLGSLGAIVHVDQVRTMGADLPKSEIGDQQLGRVFFEPNHPSQNSGCDTFKVCLMLSKLILRPILQL